MGYYGQNVDAILKMGSATSTTAAGLPAVGSDTLTEVPLVQVATPPVREKSVGSFNVLNDSDSRSIGGKKAAQSTTGTIVLDHDEAIHVNMIEDANADGGVYRNWQLLYPDGWTLTFQGFVSRLSDAAFDATGDAAEHTSEYTISVSGNITEEMVTP
jgi:hypothetical protein